MSSGSRQARGGSVASGFSAPESYKPLEPREGLSYILGTIRSYWALLRLLGKTWLTFSQARMAYMVEAVFCLRG